VDEEEDEPERRVMAVCYGPGGAGSLTTFVMLDPAGNLVDFLYCPQFRCGTGVQHSERHSVARSTQSFPPRSFTTKRGQAVLGVAPHYSCSTCTATHVPHPLSPAVPACPQRPHPAAQGAAGAGVRHV
jgi:hypothetical protein